MSRTIIRCGELFDGVDLRGPSTLVLDRGKVTEIRAGALDETLVDTPGDVLVDASAHFVMPGMVELAEDIFLKPVRRGNPTYSGALFDMVANPRSATVMGLLEEARLARGRGLKAAQQAGSMKTLMSRAKDWFSNTF